MHRPLYLFWLNALNKIKYLIKFRFCLITISPVSSNLRPINLVYSKLRFHTLLIILEHVTFFLSLGGAFFALNLDTVKEQLLLTSTQVATALQPNSKLLPL